MSLPLARHLKVLVDAISTSTTSSTQDLEFTVRVPSEAHFWDTVHDATNIPPCLLELYQQLSRADSVSNCESTTAISVLPSVLKLIASDLQASTDSVDVGIGHEKSAHQRSKRFRVQGCGFSISLKSVSLSLLDVDGDKSRATTSQKHATAAKIKHASKSQPQQAANHVTEDSMQFDTEPIESLEDRRSTTPEEPVPGESILDTGITGDVGRRRSSLHSERSMVIDDVSLTRTEDHFQEFSQLVTCKQKLFDLLRRLRETAAHNEELQQEMASQKQRHENEFIDLMGTLGRWESKNQEQSAAILNFEKKIRDLEQHGVTQDDELIEKTKALETLQKKYDYLTTTVSESHTNQTQDLENQVHDLQKLISTQADKSRHDAQDALECKEQLRRCGKRITQLTLQGLTVPELRGKCQELGMSPREVPKRHPELVGALMQKAISAEPEEVSKSKFFEVAWGE